MSALTDTHKDRLTLVDFTHDDGSARYADWDVAAGAYVATPTMDITYPPATSLLDEKPVKIVLPTDDWLHALSSGDPHPPVECRIRVLSRGDSGPDTRTLVLGDLGRVTRNPRGRKDRVRLEVWNDKELLKTALGMPANLHCEWRLGDSKTCQITIASYQETGTLALGSGPNVTITGLSSHAGDSTYWVRGRVILGGVALTIRNWDGSTGFELVRRPPSGWASQTVTVQPGCDKTQETCDARWSNLDRFFGAGFSIPAYHPVIERP